MNPQTSSEESKIPQTGEGESEQPSQELALVLRVPDGAKLPPNARFYEGEDDGFCRLIREDGTRCRARRLFDTGMCNGHSGRGIAASPSESARLAGAARAARRSARLTLGVSARRAAQPLQAARVAAQLRAEDYARAVVDAPLDDPDLGSVARQQAAIRALELLYPQATLSATVELPQEADEVAGMGWQEMQALAQQLGSPE